MVKWFRFAIKSTLRPLPVNGLLRPVSVMRLRFLLCLILLSQFAAAQDYTNVVRHRPVLWTQLDLVYRTTGRWSFQLDNIYRRQADDTNGSDLNVLRYPLLQVLRPWVTYQSSKAVWWSLSPISLWWGWNQSSRSPLTFQKSLRVTPQFVFNRSVGRSGFVLRFRTELRWLSASDTLQHVFDFLPDNAPPLIRFDTRPRLMLRWVQPLSRQVAPADAWFVQTSIEPVANVSAAGTRLDQLLVSIVFGQRVSERLRFSLGYQGLMSARKNDATHVRAIQLTHALTLGMGIGNRLRKQPGTNPVSQ